MVDGEPTVFLMVASYRDFQCRETITSAFERATHPKRVVVGAVEQNSPGDVGCTQPFKPCAEDPSQTLCRYRDQIRLFRVAAESATGPVFARHVGDRMYRGEYYAMQVDAHVTFVKDWETLMIHQFKETRNDYAVLSTYLTDVQNSISEDGRSLRKTRPIMCNSHFEGGGVTSHLRHLAQPEEVPAIQDTPMLQPFWAAGMSFSRGHFITRVPYDCCLPMLFQGEEISVGIRAWTQGYDLYAPRSSVVFHEYAVNSKRRRGIHTFWENSKRPSAGSASTSMKRMVALVRMAPDMSEDSYDHKDEALYGVGTERPVELFYKLFGMDVRRKSMVPELCKFVKSGIMHHTFVKGLRPNGKGIDYSQFQDFDIAQVISSELSRLQSAAERDIQRAIQTRRPGMLSAALDAAKRSRLKEAKPELYRQADQVLKEVRAAGKK
uniref:Uncharacterized protein n=2 Tax=Rhizochromulina marina TaxID=1034831 RepID=A0A7S2RH17_9STRA|mmetsp:Transcript_16223/g.47634  ORF Transcript_16223/g.47634 Transcript_16223/m.47634 type:complete len:436 (+) Transcript_16223:25-1332(+)